MKFKCGLYIGRFQPLHIGHTSIIDRMLEECEQVIVAVGSAQESGTERNPLSYKLRRKLIADMYADHYYKYGRMLIVPIKDRDNPSDDPTWGNYLLDKVYEQCGLRPDVIYEGKEDVRTNWYDNYSIPVIKVSRNIYQISGTDVRQAILDNREFFARVHIPYQIYDYYDEIRKEIQNAAVNSKRNPVD